MTAAPGAPRGRHLATLALTALGVVYGDIGTSPLYALRECFFGDYAVAATRENVLGVVSLIFWSLILVISVKYLLFILRADNRGEGGILVLMSLLRKRRGRIQPHAVLIALGLFGAALLYGDGMITPAISVLSAVEGLRVATPVFRAYVEPITIVILIGLFLLQHRGTGRVGAMFGPVTLIWFMAIAALGVHGIAREPHILLAVEPWHAIGFFFENRVEAYFVLGAVFLVVTGGEALYADMGHFGRRPIRLGWFALVLPALLLNYFGQGALLLRAPTLVDNPFYRLVPSWGVYPMVALATAATIIASQAVISGAFSLTRQAVQFGDCPRLEIRHTSAEEIGQIYIPWVNWILMAATIGLVLGFGSSSHLAAAYGVAVTTTMVITTILFYVAARERWGWSRLAAGAPAALFLVVDLAFFGANIVKVVRGGWFPLAVAAVVFALLSTWRRGRQVLMRRLREENALGWDEFLQSLGEQMPARVPGTAIYMVGDPDRPPLSLLHNLKHNKVLHERVVLLTVKTEEYPHVPLNERLTVEELKEGFYRLTVCYGFMQDPDIPRVLEWADRAGVFSYRPMETTFVVGRETVLATQRPGMALWRERLFSLLSRNAQRATAFFHLPPNRVIEIGAQVEI